VSDIRPSLLLTVVTAVVAGALEPALEHAIPARRRLVRFVLSFVLLAAAAAGLIALTDASESRAVALLAGTTLGTLGFQGLVALSFGPRLALRGVLWAVCLFAAMVGSTLLAGALAG
jgi:hypothetical protein